MVETDDMDTLQETTEDIYHLVNKVKNVLDKMQDVNSIDILARKTCKILLGVDKNLHFIIRKFLDCSYLKTSTISEDDLFKELKDRIMHDKEQTPPIINKNILDTSTAEISTEKEVNLKDILNMREFMKDEDVEAFMKQDAEKVPERNEQEDKTDTDITVPDNISADTELTNAQEITVNTVLDTDEFVKEEDEEDTIIKEENDCPPQINTTNAVNQYDNIILVDSDSDQTDIEENDKCSEDNFNLIEQNNASALIDTDESHIIPQGDIEINSTENFEIENESKMLSDLEELNDSESYLKSVANKDTSEMDNALLLQKLDEVLGTPDNEIQKLLDIKSLEKQHNRKRPPSTTKLKPNPKKLRLKSKETNKKNSESSETNDSDENESNTSNVTESNETVTERPKSCAYMIEELILNQINDVLSDGGSEADMESDKEDNINNKKRKKLKKKKELTNDEKEEQEVNEQAKAQGKWRNDYLLKLNISDSDKKSTSKKSNVTNKQKQNELTIADVAKDVDLNTVTNESSKRKQVVSSSSVDTDDTLSPTESVKAKMNILPSYKVDEIQNKMDYDSDIEFLFISTLINSQSNLPFTEKSTD